jgi:hypothetical protein
MSKSGGSTRGYAPLFVAASAIVEDMAALLASIGFS